MTTNLTSRNSNAATAQAAVAVLILPDDETDATVAAADKSKDFHYCNHHHHHHHELLEAHCIHSSCPTKNPNLVSSLQAETTLSSTAQLKQVKNPNPNENHVNKKLNDDGKTSTMNLFPIQIFIHIVEELILLQYNYSMVMVLRPAAAAN